jgi:hypothetical protein
VAEHTTPSLSVDGGTPREYHEDLQQPTYAYLMCLSIPAGKTKCRQKTSCPRCQDFVQQIFETIESMPFFSACQEVVVPGQE